jgi:hypothetical protein
MALVGRHNIAMMKSTTTGTGTLTLTTAVRGFLTFALAGVVNLERVTYTIRDGANTEVGAGTYTSSGTTLSRDTVLSSTNSGSAISCSGRQTVAITVAAEDITPFASYYYNGTNSIANGASNSTLSLDTEWVDHAGIGSVSSNAVTLAKKGWYQYTLSVNYSAGAALNGALSVVFQSVTTRHAYATAMSVTGNQLYATGLLSIGSDATSLATATLTNDTGQTLTVFIYELTLWKIGNK